MRKIKIIGVGPGGPSFITPEALAAIGEATVIIGGRRHLEIYAPPGRESHVLSGNLEEILDVVRNRGEKGVAVLATGDPGMYGILKYLRTHFNPEDIEVIPGISSVQLAFARLCLPWHDAVVLSAHGRPAEKLAELAGNVGKAAVLTGTDNPPEKVFEILGQSGGQRKYYFCFDLSLPSESVIKLSSGDVFPDDFKGRHNCVMVMVDE